MNCRFLHQGEKDPFFTHSSKSTLEIGRNCLSLENCKGGLIPKRFLGSSFLQAGIEQIKMALPSAEKAGLSFNLWSCRLGTAEDGDPRGCPLEVLKYRPGSLTGEAIIDRFKMATWRLSLRR